MRILFLGDVMGRVGRRAVIEGLPGLREELRLDFVVVNGENAASGVGMTAEIGEKIFAAGADVITLGDHAFDQKEMLTHIDRDKRIIRPLNYARTAPGRGVGLYDAPRGRKVLVAQALGRVFMSRQADCPFAAADRAIEELAARTRVILCDVHAEATSEKVALGWHLDGRVSAVFGTHTHVPTADARVLPQGTAYITDLGMTGPYASVLGRAVKPVLHHFVTGMPSPFKVATDDVRLCGALVRIDAASGRAGAIERFELREEELAR